MATQFSMKIMQQNLDKLIDKVVETELRRRADNVIAEIQKLAPRSDGTRSYTDGVSGVTTGGRLSDSFRVGFTTDHGKKVIRIFSTAQNSRGQFYAGIVSKGSGPHLISAKKAPNLAFQWIRTGAFVFTPSVNHPGTQPNNYLKQALKNGFHR